MEYETNIVTQIVYNLKNERGLFFLRLNKFMAPMKT